MVRFWRQEGGLLRKTDAQKAGERVWIDARKVTQEEARRLCGDLGIDQELMMDILDPDELSRIEAWDGYSVVIVRLPVYNPGEDVAYTTAPLGAVIFPDKIVTVCWTDCEVLSDLSANRIRDLSLDDFPAFAIRILARADTLFLRYLKEISRRANTIQMELQESVENSDLIQLLNLEKSLTYFTTSLKANQLLLEKIRRTKILRLDEEDREWLDDVEVDNRQAMEMTSTYSAITEGTMNAFASVISNNMNVVMKRLTDISISLAMMSFVASFWGMNIRLPWGESKGWTGLFSVIAICVLSPLAYFSINVALGRRKRRKLKRGVRK